MVGPACAAEAEKNQGAEGPGRSLVWPEPSLSEEWRTAGQAVEGGRHTLLF